MEPGAEISVELGVLLQGFRAVRNQMSTELRRISPTTKEKQAEAMHCSRLLPQEILNNPFKVISTKSIPLGTITVRMSKE